MRSYGQVLTPTLKGKAPGDPSAPGAFFMGPIGAPEATKNDLSIGRSEKKSPGPKRSQGSRNGSEPLQTDSVWVAVIGQMSSEPKGEWSGPVAGELRETTSVVVEEVAEIPLALGD